MAATVNYTGRTVDLFIFQGAKIGGEAQINLGFGGDTGGEVISGIEKMAQTWAILFLNEVGSIQYDPDIGTSFVTDYRLGLIRDEGDVQSAFGLAATQVANQMALAAQSATLPVDELLSTANLIRFVIDKRQGKLVLYVRLTSQAGVAHDILLPIPLAIQ